MKNQSPNQLQLGKKTGNESLAPRRPAPRWVAIGASLFALVLLVWSVTPNPELTMLVGSQNHLKLAGYLTVAVMFFLLAGGHLRRIAERFGSWAICVLLLESGIVFHFSRPYQSDPTVQFFVVSDLLLMAILVPMLLMMIIGLHYGGYTEERTPKKPGRLPNRQANQSVTIAETGGKCGITFSQPEKRSETIPS